MATLASDRPYRRQKWQQQFHQLKGRRAESRPARCSIFLRKPKQLLIGGKWVPAKSGKTFETINPANEEVLALAAEGDKADVDEAVKAARKALETANGRPSARISARRYLLKIADLIEKHADEIGTLESLNNGMAISLAKRHGERRGRYLPLLRRMGDQDLRRDQSVRSLDVQLHAARTGRRVRTDHSVERPGRDVRVENRAGAGVRQRIASSSPPSRRRSPRCSSAN